MANGTKKSVSQHSFFAWKSRASRTQTWWVSIFPVVSGAASNKLEVRIILSWCQNSPSRLLFLFHPWSHSPSFCFFPVSLTTLGSLSEERPNPNSVLCQDQIHEDDHLTSFFIHHSKCSASYFLHFFLNRNCFLPKKIYHLLLSRSLCRARKRRWNFFLFPRTKKSYPCETPKIYLFCFIRFCEMQWRKKFRRSGLIWFPKWQLRLLLILHPGIESPLEKYISFFFFRPYI